MEDVPAGDDLAPCTRFLINHRLVQLHSVVPDAQVEVALGVDCNGFRSGQGEPDGVRVRARRQDVIVLQLVVVSVIHQIHARVDVRIFHFGVGRNRRAPLRAIGAPVVVHLAGLFRDAADCRVRVGVQQLAMESRRRSAGRKHQHGFGRCEKQRLLAGMGQEFHCGIRLSPVRFKD